MKIIKFIIAIFLLFLFTNTTSALTSWDIKNIVKNTKTWEIRVIIDQLPWKVDNLFHMEIGRLAYSRNIWEEILENWIIICHYDDTNDSNIIKEWECELLDKTEKISFNDLTKKDKINVVLNILGNYLFCFLLWIPFNFWVFFCISYLLFWKKFSLIKHLVFTMLFTIFLDLILIYFNLSFMQLNWAVLWVLLYAFYIVSIKIVFMFFSVYLFVYKYSKEKGFSSKYNRKFCSILMLLIFLFIFWFVL